jgi:hypothetical protein
MFDCFLVGIQRFSQYLALQPSSSSREKERRVLALRFLGHFVGDLHQPLHTGFTEDLGGNRIDVHFVDANGHQQTDNLHAVWDGQVLRRAGLITMADADTLNAEITTTQASQWAMLSIADWAAEAHDLARLHEG